MTKQEIIEKAVKKATANGWPWIADFETEHTWVFLIPNKPGVASRGYYIKHVMDVGLFIFNHDFAKALWGEQDLQGLDIVKEFGLSKSHNPTFENWQKHLMQMVIAEDPLKYLKENT